MINYDLTQLETRGYVIIPNFLSAEKVLECQELYNSIKSTTDNRNYSLKKSNTNIVPEVLALLKEINATTDISANSISKDILYFDNSLINFGWHQDHESYYRWQNPYSSLNFWIPIIKTTIDKSGLSVVPFDRLRSIIPDIVDSRIRNRGAKRFSVNSNGTTQMFDDELDTEVTLPLDLDAISETPPLLPGDLILMREDTIHKTQLISDHRVAMSVRCIDSNAVLTADNFYFGSNLKKEMIRKNPLGYLDLVKCFRTKQNVVAHESIKHFDNSFDRKTK
jgi:hypothetical protein